MAEHEHESGTRAALEELAKKQREELRAFEERQRRELEEFEARERAEIKEFEQRQHHEFTIRIDRSEYRVHVHHLTGLELRSLAAPPIGPERDLFEVVPGGSDRKIENGEKVRIEDGLRFFTAPAQINPGRM